MHGRRGIELGCVLWLLGALGGCSEHHCEQGVDCTESKSDGDGDGDRSRPGDDGDDEDTSNSSGSEQPSGGGGTPRPSSGSGSGDDCGAATVSKINTTVTDKLDLLFIVDNSGSMAQEQASLREQFPRMIQLLTSGDLGDGSPRFSPVKDLHLGVVSTDMGLVGINDIDKCVGLGDDAVMQNEPRIQGCHASYPRFLTYNEGLNSPQVVANDFVCVSMLGTDGCGFEQQLEAGLKSLWPGQDSRITFLGDVNNFSTMGHGDNDNQGFLRNDPVQGLSLVSVVLVTDEEDCSSQNTMHLTPAAYLDPQNPADAELLAQGLNVRCHFNEQNLYDVQRYINGFKALRPGNENMVVFSAIVGVPVETVSPDVLARTDFGNAQDRELFYDGILDHPLMQPVVESNGTPNDPQDDTMRPSCKTESGLAYPPRRIVETARGFGGNGLVQSICQSDFTPAIDAIVRNIGRQLTNVGCLPRPIERDDDGLIGCSLVWDLPAAGTAPAGTPTDCSDADWPFLSDTGARGERGGARCRVLQLPVKNGEQRPARSNGVSIADGWFYDDFSDELAQACSTLPQRVAFTPNAKPPTGVSVQLHCAPSGAACETPGLGIQ